jgi:tRNA (guanine37-N1)-methyltransferase
MRQCVLDLFNFPFPAYSIPIPAKARAKAARIARQPNADGSLPTPIPVVEGPKRNLIDHFVMNLPNSALEFLDAFRGIYRELLEAPGGREAVEERGEDRLPMVHCYCFVKGATTDAEAEADVLEVCPLSRMR